MLTKWPPVGPLTGRVLLPIKAMVDFSAASPTFAAAAGQQRGISTDTSTAQLPPPTGPLVGVKVGVKVEGAQPWAASHQADAAAFLSFSVMLCIDVTRTDTPGAGWAQVLDLGQVVAGNFCGALLSYFGADVIKARGTG